MSDETRDDSSGAGEARPVRRPWWKRRKYRVLGLLLVIIGVVIGPWPIRNTTYEGSRYQRSTLKRLAETTPAIAPAAELRIGTAEVDITPPAGHPLAGFFKLRRSYQKVATRCYARAVTLSGGDVTVTILAVDLLIVNAKMAEAVLAKTGLEPGDVFFTATHTHSGPGGWGDHPLEELSAGSYDPEFFETLTGQMADAVTGSRQSSTPAECAVVTTTTTKRQANRVNRDWPTFDTMSALFFRRARPAGEPATTQPDDELLASLASFSAHPTSCGAYVDDLDGDYPAALCRRLQEAGGVGLALFAAGAVGDSRPKRPPGATKTQATHNLGRQLADELMAALPSATFERRPMLANLRLNVDLAALRVPLSEHLRLSPICTHWIHAPRTHLQVLRIGSAVLVGMPGDYSGELATVLADWGGQRGLTIVPTSFNGDYIGYLMSHRTCVSRWAYETRVMSFFGHYTGEYLSELSRRMIERLEPR